MKGGGCSYGVFDANLTAESDAHDHTKFYPYPRDGERLVVHERCELAQCDGLLSSEVLCPATHPFTMQSRMRCKEYAENEQRAHDRALERHMRCAQTSPPSEVALREMDMILKQYRSSKCFIPPVDRRTCDKEILLGWESFEDAKQRSFKNIIAFDQDLARKPVGAGCPSMPELLWNNRTK